MQDISLSSSFTDALIYIYTAVYFNTRSNFPKLLEVLKERSRNNPLAVQTPTFNVFWTRIHHQVNNFYFNKFHLVKFFFSFFSLVLLFWKYSITMNIVFVTFKMAFCGYCVDSRLMNDAFSRVLFLLILSFALLFYYDRFSHSLSFDVRPFFVYNLVTIIIILLTWLCKQACNNRAPQDRYLGTFPRVILYIRFFCWYTYADQECCICSSTLIY